MQEYLWKNSFREKMDGLGFHVLAFAACCGWFILLWGIRLQSLLAGGALWGMVLILRHKTRDHRLARKEEKLRRQLGGEMRLQSLLLRPAEQANFEMALLLSERENFQLQRITKGGILCSKDGKSFLLVFLQLPFDESITGRDVLACRRAALKEGADGVLMCVPCGVTSQARAQIENETSLRILEKDRLVQLLGAAYPATDRQLVDLGRKRKRKPPLAHILRTVLRPEKARRYAAYGAMLLLLYCFTGMFYYALPGLICVSLSAASRCTVRQ